MADARLERIESYQYPATHLGHLNTQQEAALEKFKQLCQAKNYYTPAAPGGQSPASHDDETLLRYLRARKWSPQEAFAQFKDTEEWRKENQLDTVYNNIDIEDYDQARRLYPQWTGRRDRRGIPVYVFEVAHLNSKAVAHYESSASKSKTLSTSKIPPKMMRLFALYENLTNFVLPLCSQLPDRAYPETPVSQSNNIVDISHVGLKQFWNLKGHMQDASTLATAHYPETLDRIFIIGAPSFFPTVWGWIKKWFDPITVSKIFILSDKDMKRTLEQYIAPEHIPKKYGGQLDYEFGQLPNLDPAIDKTIDWSHPATQNGKRTFPTGPIRLERTSDGSVVALAVGSEGGRPRHTEIGSLPSSEKKTEKSVEQPRQSNLQVDDRTQPAAMFRTTSGISTHPPSPPANAMEDEPPRSDSESSDIYGGSPGPTAASAATAAAAQTYNLPDRTANRPTEGQSTFLNYRPGGGSSTPPVRSAEQQPTSSTGFGDPSSGQYSEQYPSSDTRGGTSSTRYEQQDATLAKGQMAEGTPAVRSTGDGNSHSVMEPNTVGQAPKEHPVPEQEEPAPSYIEQAKGLAGTAYASAAGVAGAALSAVGYGKEGQKVEEEAQKETGKIPEDPAVDQAKEHNVEEYLRSQYKSPAAHNK